MADTMPDSRRSDESWHMKEFDWTGKSFYFVNYRNIFSIAIGLSGKLEQLNRDIITARYKKINSTIYVELGKSSCKIMLEIEKPLDYNAQVFTYDEPTVVDTLVVRGNQKQFAKGIQQLNERVYAKRETHTRQLFKVYNTGNPDRHILIGLT